MAGTRLLTYSMNLMNLPQQKLVSLYKQHIENKFVSMALVKLVLDRNVIHLQ